MYSILIIKTNYLSEPPVKILRVSTPTDSCPERYSLCTPNAGLVADFFFFKLRLDFSVGNRWSRIVKILLFLIIIFPHKQHQSISDSLQRKDTKRSPVLFTALLGRDSNAMNSRAKGHALCF